MEKGLMQYKAALKICSSILMITRQGILLYRVIKGEIPDCAGTVPEVLSSKDVQKNFDMVIDSWEEKMKND